MLLKLTGDQTCVTHHFDQSDSRQATAVVALLRMATKARRHSRD